MGLGTAVEGIKGVAGALGTAIGETVSSLDQDDLIDGAKHIGKRAVQGAGVGAATGAVASAVQGKNMWDGAGVGAKRGAIAGIGVGAYEEGSAAYRNRDMTRGSSGNGSVSGMALPAPVKPRLPGGGAALPMPRGGGGGGSPTLSSPVKTLMGTQRDMAMAQNVTNRGR